MGLLTMRAAHHLRRVLRRSAAVAAGLAVLHALPAFAAGAQSAPAPFPLAPPETYVTDVAVSEETQSRVQDDLQASLIAGVRRFDWGLAAGALTADFEGRFPLPGQGTAVADHALAIRRYAGDGLAPLGRDALLGVLRAHVDAWVSVDRAAWQMFEFLLAPERDRAFALAHFQLGGPAADGARTVLNATVAVELVDAADGGWRIRRLDVVDATRVSNPVGPFRDITDAVGLHFNRSETNIRIRQDAANGGMSLIDSALGVVDWNRDGFWDIVATEAANHAVLFLNDGRGGFVREALPFRDDRLIPSQLLFVDLDGDGLEEIVGTRIVYSGARGWLGVYTRREGEWRLLPRALEFDNPPGVRRYESQLLTAGDVNGDGLLDIFVGATRTTARAPAAASTGSTPTTATTTCCSSTTAACASRRSPRAAASRARAIRTSGSSSTSTGTATSTSSKATTTAATSSGAIGATARSGPSRITRWRETAPSRWASPSPTGTTAATGASISPTCTRMPGTAWCGLTGSVSDAMHDRLGVLARGNQLFTLGEAGGASGDRGVPLGVNEAGWAWGSHFFDLDNDGDKEIFVTNGNTSHVDPEAPDY